MSDFVTLGDHISIQKGKPPLAIDYVGKQAEPYLNPEYLRGRAQANLAKAGPDAVRAADGNTILLWDGSNAGEFFRAKSGLIASTMAKISPSKAFLSTYFFHVAKHAENYLKAQTSGTGIPHVDRELLEAIRIFCPDINQQQVIAEILDALDTATHETEAIIAKLKAVKQGLLHDLLTRGIDAKGELRPTQAEAPHLYKESPLGWIPKEWMPVPVGKLASLQRGHDIVETRFRPGPYPVVSSSGVIGHHAVATSRGPNVVVGRKGSIGTVHYVDDDFWAHDTSLFVTNFFDNDAKFVFHLFEYMRLGRYGTKSGSPSLNRNDVHPLIVGRPTRDEQVLIVAVASAHETVTHRTSLELAKLKQLKLSLMDDLLTGRVRVTPLLEAAAP